MKKKIWIPVIAVIAAAIMLIPIPTGIYKDGGTREYTALTYKIVVWNRLTENSTYSKTKVYFFLIISNPLTVCGNLRNRTSKIQ